MEHTPAEMLHRAKLLARLGQAEAEMDQCFERLQAVQELLDVGHGRSWHLLGPERGAERRIRFHQAGMALAKLRLAERQVAKAVGSVIQPTTAQEQHQGDDEQSVKRDRQQSDADSPGDEEQLSAPW